MSLFEGKKIIGLLVETTSGDKLGHIYNFDLDIRKIKITYENYYSINHKTQIII